MGGEVVRNCNQDVLCEEKKNPISTNGVGRGPSAGLDYVSASGVESFLTLPVLSHGVKSSDFFPLKNQVEGTNKQLIISSSLALNVLPR